MKKRLPPLDRAGIVAAVLALAALLVWVRRDPGPQTLNLAEFETKLDAGEVQDATIKDRDNTVTGTLSRRHRRTRSATPPTTPTS